MSRFVEGRVLLAALTFFGCEVSTASPWHVVRVGNESLGEIAVRTHVSVERLQAMNGLKDDVVRWETGLLVPENEVTRALPVWEPPMPAPGWETCDAVEWVPAVDAPQPDRCAHRTCAGEVCLCQSTEDEPSGEFRFGVATWKTELWPMNPTLRHARVDLDGDGKPESVVSVRFAVGNGLGLESWNHTVISKGRPVATFSSVDYGLSYVRQAKGCALMAVRVEDQRDQLRGWGLYWVARLHVLQGEAMRAVGPDVARRYTFRFADQRWASLEGVTQPVPWFSDRGAFVARASTAPTTCRSANVMLEDDDGKFDLGALGVYQRRGWHEEGAPPVLEYDEVLDGVTGAPMLEDYRTFGEARWTGRKATVCDSVREGEPHTTLAFE